MVNVCIKQDWCWFYRYYYLNKDIVIFGCFNGFYGIQKFFFNVIFYFKDNFFIIISNSQIKVFVVICFFG